MRSHARRVLDLYRRGGADPPFRDPGRAHGVGLEGYYWRIVDSSSGRVVVCLCGVCRGDWAVVACAAHPGGFVRWAPVAPAGARGEGFGADAGEALRGSAHSLTVRLDGASVDVQLRPRVVWPRLALGALGPAHLIPGLPQYWHPVVLAADVEGEACLDRTRVRLDGASAYLEKNWGPGFAGRWWWGHAGAFPDGDMAVAFAGGPVLGRAAATAVVIRVGSRLLRFAPPLAYVSADGWRVRARSVRYSVELEGDPAGTEPHLLPVPDVAAGRVEMRSQQYLAGRLHVRLRRGRRTLLDETSPLAGLEVGAPAGEVSAPPHAEQPR
jgi:tocopherol cyclase